MKKELRNLALGFLALVFVASLASCAWADVAITLSLPYQVDFGSGFPEGQDYKYVYLEEPDSEEMDWGISELKIYKTGQVDWWMSGLQHLEHPDGDPLAPGGPGSMFYYYPATRIDLIGFNFPSGWRLPATEIFKLTPNENEGKSPAPHESHWDSAQVAITHESRDPTNKKDNYTFRFTLNHTYDNPPAVPEPATIISSLLGLAGFALRRFRKV